MPSPQPEAAPARAEPTAGRLAVTGVPGELVLFPQRPHPAAPAEPVAADDAGDEGTDELDRILADSRRYRLAVTRRELRRRTTPGRAPREPAG